MSQQLITSILSITDKTKKLFFKLALQKELLLLLIYSFQFTLFLKEHYKFILIAFRYTTIWPLFIVAFKEHYFVNKQIIKSVFH